MEIKHADYGIGEGFTRNREGWVSLMGGGLFVTAEALRVHRDHRGMNL